VARNWDVEKAKAMFEAAMQWREENDIDNIIERFENSEYYDPIINYWPCSVCRAWDFWTYDNSWIVYQRLTQMDVRLVEQVPMEAIIDYHKFVVEVVEKKHAKIVAQKGFSPGGIVIEDLSGLGYQHMHKKVIEMIAMIAKIDDNYYPAILRKFCIINAPYVFTVFWGIIKQFLHPRTAEKFEVLGSDKESNEAYFKKIIPEKYLPNYLGGQSEFHMPVGGKIETANIKLPLHYKTVSIKAGSSHKHEVEITKGPVTLNWEFTVQHYDIKFSIVKEGVSIVDVASFKASSQKVTGSLEVAEEEVGMYSLIWDNSYSYWHGKTVIFRLTIQ